MSKLENPFTNPYGKKTDPLVENMGMPVGDVRKMETDESIEDIRSTAEEAIIEAGKSGTEKIREIFQKVVADSSLIDNETKKIIAKRIKDWIKQNKVLQNPEKLKEVLAHTVEQLSTFEDEKIGDHEVDDMIVNAISNLGRK